MADLTVADIMDRDPVTASPRDDVASLIKLIREHELPGVPVVVGADRYLSGCLAERHLGATVHLLDDGFQHLELARDVDLLLVSEDDLQDRPLPAAATNSIASAGRSCCTHVSPMFW